MRLLPTSFMVVLVTALLVTACGDDKGACQAFCEDTRTKLLQQMPDIEPEDVQCSEPPWTEADTCEACKQILNDLFDITVDDTGEFCRQYFS